MSKKSTATLDRENSQLTLCRQLIDAHSFHSQQEIRMALQLRGYPEISQSTVSKLLTLLDVVKVANARGEKIYALASVLQSKPDAVSPLSAMVVSVDYNEKFIVVHVAAGYACAVARVIEHWKLDGILGVVATNNCIWIAPRTAHAIRRLHQHITALLQPCSGEEQQAWRDAPSSDEAGALPVRFP